MKVERLEVVRFAFQARGPRPTWRGPWRLVRGVWLRATDRGLVVGPVLNTSIRTSAAPDLYAGYYATTPVIAW